MEKLGDILSIIYIIFAFSFLIYCWVKLAKMDKKAKKDMEEFEETIRKEKTQLKIMEIYNKSKGDSKDEV